MNGRTTAHRARLVPVFLFRITYNTARMVFHLDGKYTAWPHYEGIHLSPLIPLG